MFRVKITVFLSLLIVILMVIVYIQLPTKVETEIIESTSNTLHIAAAGLDRKSVV